ncbi:hypothetical protein LINGRAHAP2_LOCUS12120 [Linum grandiflorum]
MIFKSILRFLYTRYICLWFLAFVYGVACVIVAMEDKELKKKIGWSAWILIGHFFAITGPVWRWGRYWTLFTGKTSIVVGAWEPMLKILGPAFGILGRAYLYKCSGPSKYVFMAAFAGYAVFIAQFAKFPVNFGISDLCLGALLLGSVERALLMDWFVAGLLFIHVAVLGLIKLALDTYKPEHPDVYAGLDALSGQPGDAQRFADYNLQRLYEEQSSLISALNGCTRIAKRDIDFITRRLIRTVKNLPTIYGAEPEA